MSAPWLALKRTTTDVLSTVSATTGAITQLADTASELASVAAVNARAYRQETETVLAQDQTRRLNRRVHELAVQDAEFYLDIEKRMNGNQRLQELYQASLASYQQPSKLSVAAE